MKRDSLFSARVSNFRIADDYVFCSRQDEMQKLYVYSLLSHFMTCISVDWRFDSVSHWYWLEGIRG